MSDAAMPDNPCECGCGQDPGVYASTSMARGIVRGEPKRYMTGHQSRDQARAPAPIRLCQIDGCNRPHKSHGWCGTHYMRWRRVGDPGQAELMRCRPVPDGYKECPTCGKLKLIEGNFYRSTKTGRPLPTCRACVARRNRTRYAEDREQRIAWQAGYRTANLTMVRKSDRARSKTAYDKAKADGRCIWKQGRGCQEPAMTWSLMCEPHREAARAKNWRRYHGVYLASYAARGLVGCWLCGDDFTEADPLQHDHLIPQVENGSDEPWNLAPAHSSCNNYRNRLGLIDTVARWHPDGIEDVKVAVAVAEALRRFADENTDRGEGVT